MKHSLLRNVFALALVATSFASQAQTLVDGIYYYFYSDTTCDVTAKKTRTQNTNTYSGVVNVPEQVTYAGVTFTVTGVMSYAFDGSTSVTEVTLPATVTDIGSYSFRNTKSLKSITIPKSVQKIEGYAFDGSGLESVTIPDEIGDVGSGAFQNCVSLTSFSTGDGLATLHSYVLKNDSALTELKLGKNCTELSAYCIQNCTGFESFTIPATVNKVGAYFAAGTQFKSLTIEDSDSTLTVPTYFFFIGDSVPLTDVYLGRNLSKYYCFTKVNVKSLTIGEKVTAFDANWPVKATGITSVTSLIGDPTQLVPTFSDTVYATATLTVPRGTKELYEKADGWKPFYKIVEDDNTGVSDIAAGLEATEVARYAIDGRCLAEPQPGINIVMMSDGTTRKVLVR